MTNTKIKATTTENKIIIGKVVLIYTDAVISGTNEYTPITEMLVKEKGGKIHTIKPRNVIEVIKKKK